MFCIYFFSSIFVRANNQGNIVIMHERNADSLVLLQNEKWTSSLLNELNKRGLNEWIDWKLVCILIMRQYFYNNIGIYLKKLIQDQGHKKIHPT